MIAMAYTIKKGMVENTPEMTDTLIGDKRRAFVKALAEVPGAIAEAWDLTEDLVFEIVETFGMGEHGWPCEEIRRVEHYTMKMHELVARQFKLRDGDDDG